ncbi:ComE operon protein 1 [mine drainage metagenome]|uniref:ComE operon protein 1 n=1 Tax=mine drainage metagenome TaxID=410659 RepID=A0A1J5QF87_9ZZZZ
MSNRVPREYPDVDSTRARRLGALGTASTVYSAAYGHPLEHDDLETTAGGIPLFRWTLRPAIAVVAVLAITALGCGVVVWSARAAPGVGVPLGIAVATAGGATAAASDRAEASNPGVPTTGAGAGTGVGASGAPTGGRAAGVVVHVVGQVASPGVVRLPVGSRVTDAIDAAGGATADADLSVVNLARVLVDGEQVLVPRPGESPVVPGQGAVRAADAPLDLNAATLADLDALPGIGPVLAQRILDWRTAHGRFTDVEELAEVSGIGPSVLSRLRDQVRV